MTAARHSTNSLEPVRKGHPGITIHSTVIQGRPAPLLGKASQEADLHVVGSREHGEVPGMLLGLVSVSTASPTPPARHWYLTIGDDCPPGPCKHGRWAEAPEPH